jgi:hypothetical protein
VSGDASESLGTRDGTSIDNGAQSLRAHTLMPLSHPSEPLQLSSTMPPSPSFPERSDCTEDSSSAYAETLEGGSGTRNGAPFYPGMDLLSLRAACSRLA